MLHLWSALKICIHVLHLHPLCFIFLLFSNVLHMHYVLQFALVIALFCLCTPVPVLFVVAAPFAPTCIKLSHPFYGICTSHNCDSLRHWFVRLIPLTRQPMILFSHPAAITKTTFWISNLSMPLVACYYWVRATEPGTCWLLLENRDGFRRGVRGGAGLPPPDRMIGFLTKIFQFFSMYFWSLDHFFFQFFFMYFWSFDHIFPIFLNVFLVTWPHFPIFSM